MPRWLVGLLVGTVMLWFGWGMVREPSWVIQRLESPDGNQTAYLTRVMYLNQFWQIELQRVIGRERVFRSGPLPADFKKDMRERLLWSGDSRQLYLSVEGRLVWGLEVKTGRMLDPSQLNAAQLTEAERICR
jgi:hypothetical protein